MQAYRIVVAADSEEVAVAVLWEMGTQGVEVRPLPEDAVALIAYFAELTDALGQLDRALAPAAPRQIEAVPVPDVDWLARFREGFQPLTVGRFHVVPAWRAEPSPGGLVRLVVDPGRAFGTGTHETTRLCLEALERLASHGPLPEPVLDVGTGSGILAVAACRLGARHVIAIDNDPEALRSAGEHARLNDVGLELVLADGARALQPGRFGLVLANVATAFLCSRAPELAGLLGPGGTLVLAGLLGEDSRAVSDAYAFLGEHELHTEGEWAALVYRKERQ